MKVRKSVCIMLVLLLLLSLSACGANSGATAGDHYYRNEAMAPEAEAGIVTESGSTVEVLPENRKLIKTVTINAETEDLDTLLSQLDGKIAELGGYVEARDVHNGSSYAQHRYRNANLTVRIPADTLDSFVSHVSGASNVVSSKETVEDVTLQYVDTESRVTALETEQERLMALLEQAESLQDILEIEARLTDVRYELESYASYLRTLENQVTYATVHLYISEVQEYTPVAEKTVWQRIAGGFMDSLEGIGDGAVELLVWVLANSPYLLLWGAISAAVIILLKKKKLTKAKKITPPEKTE